MPRETNRTTKPKHRNRCITPEYELFLHTEKINGEETYEKPQIIENRGGGPTALFSLSRVATRASEKSAVA